MAIPSIARCGVSRSTFWARKVIAPSLPIYVGSVRECLRLQSLVLAGTRAPADNEQEKQARFQQVEQMLANGMTGIAEASLPKLLSSRTLAQEPEVVARVREMILRAAPEGAAAAQRGMAARRDYSDDLTNIKAPALVIVGREDPIRPVADAEFMHRALSGSALVIIEVAAHMTNMEQPEA